MSKVQAQHKVLGVLGGGQLGSMMLDPIHRLGLQARFMDPDPLAPVAMRFPSAVCAPFSDAQAVLDFGRGCDVLTYELEAVHAGALTQLEGEGIEVWHRPEILALLQNKISQKEFYVREGLPTAPFHSFERLDELKAFWRMPEGEMAGLFHPSAVWKAARGGYDGKGVQILDSLEDLVNLPDTPALLEQKIDIALELAVITVRDQKGNIRCYDPCLMHFDPRANLVSRVMAGSSVETEALLPNHLRSQAMEMAAAVAEGLGTVGVLAVEFLLDTQGRLLVNESAPRPHNSGHYTIEAAHCSQFEQHIRAVMGWPLGDTSLRSAAVMVNLVGAEGFRGPVVYPGLDQVLSLPGVFVHLYGKAETRPFRKMGHVTVVHPDLAVANQIADRVEACLRIEAANGLEPSNFL